MSFGPEPQRTVLITGAAGLCGASIAAALDRRPGVQVLTTSRRALPRPGHVRHDLRSPFPSELVSSAIDAVIHCAAVVDEDTHDYSVVDDNLRMAFNTMSMAQAHGASVLINLSSIAVYGQTPSPPPISEASPLRPVTSYGLAKVLCETMLSTSASRVCHLRLAYVLAPTMPARYFIRRVASRIEASQPVEVVNPDSTRFSFIEVADVAGACLAALDRSAEGAYNLAADVRPTARDVIATIATHHPESTTTYSFVERPAERIEASFDTRRIKNLCGVDSIGDPLAAIGAASL